MITQFKTSMFLFLLLSHITTTWATDVLTLPVGLLEGVSGELGAEYKLIEINENGQHRMFNMPITSGFSKGSSIKFNNDDIICTSTECAINVITSKSGEGSGNEAVRLIITPFQDESYWVMEINVNAKKQPLLTKSYRLEKQRNQSTVREFIAKYHQRLKTLSVAHDGDIYGFWIGTIMLNGKNELVAFEVNREGKSHFTRFISGQNFDNTTSFSPENLKMSGQMFTIETEHATFANQIIVHQLSQNMLSGYMYAIRKNQLIGQGTFSLYRLQLN